MDTFLSRSTFLHRGLPLALGWFLPIGAALIMNAEPRPTWEEAAAAGGVGLASAWLLGLLLRPIVDLTQTWPQRIRPYRSMYLAMNEIYFAYGIRLDRNVSMQLEDRFRGTRYHAKYFSECLIKEIMERSISVSPFGIVLGAVVYRGTGATWAATSLFFGLGLVVVAAVFALGAVQVRKCLEWTVTALRDSSSSSS